MQAQTQGLSSLQSANRERARIGFLGSLAALLLGLAALAGCESGSSTATYDHVPPAGQGSILVNNLTWSAMSVYVGGELVVQINTDAIGTVDLAPGTYSVVLNEDQSQGNHSYSADVAVLDANLTVLRVTMNTSDVYSYNVTTTYE